MEYLFKKYYSKRNKINSIKEKDKLPKNIEECRNLDDIEKLALSKLNNNAISYFITGANNEITLNRNKKYFQKIILNPKLFIKNKPPNLSTNIFNKNIEIPIGISPSALHKLAHEDGEIATAKAAEKNCSILILSSRSSTTIEEVAKANGKGTRWFQLYMMKNKEDNIILIKKAEINGYSALVLTVDAPIIGYRDRDYQMKFKKPDNISYDIEKNLIEIKSKLEKDKENEYLARKIDNENENNLSKKNDNFNYYKNSTDSSLDWSVINWLRKYTKLPLILKGITYLEDALKAAEYDIDGIIISNHGGRQLDTSPSTIEILHSIKLALDKYYENSNKKRIELFIDSGFRKGEDIIKALALGAKAVFLGRPIIWGLACEGEFGINKTFEILKNEIIEAMKITGCNKIEDLNINIINKYLSKF